MKRWISSLYGKISVVFLLLLLIIGLVQVWITLHSSEEFIRETEQKFNATLAANLVTALTPYLQDSVDYKGLESTIRFLMMVNPRIEIYLLDERGTILNSFINTDRQVAISAVELAPIREFLSGESSFPILGDDPCCPGDLRPFSTAPLQIGSRKGYLYVILDNQSYETVSAMVRNSYIIRTSLQIFIIIILATAVVGLISFACLTRRFRKMTEVVKKFEQGDLQQRISTRSTDEIGQLARAFNQMADTIVRNLDELRTKDRLRRELIANVSHDLRSPLASIQGYLETLMMKDKELPPEDRRRYLEVMLKNARQLSRLVTELFDLSKLDAGVTRPRMETFCLAELTQDVLLKFKPRADAKRIRLGSTLPPELPPVKADIAMIERALSNLIDNALTYTPEGGEVKVELLPSNGKVRVRVMDTGSGIPPEDLPFVFEHFYRVDKSRTPSKSGSGLGLTIVKRILEAHNSSVSVDSAPNKGTTITFELPTAAEAVSEASRYSS